MTDLERRNNPTPDQSETHSGQMYPPPIEARVKLIAEDAFGIHDVIAGDPARINKIYDNLERVEKRLPKKASKEVRASHFRSEGLFFASGLIISGNNQENVEGAMSLLEEQFPRISRFHLRDELTAHILLYLAKKGYEERANDPKKHATWKNIIDYLNDAFQQKGDETNNTRPR